ncbi:MAG: hypothetical protein ACJ75J_01100, partial [Cytophagaceae bacterium]
SERDKFLYLILYEVLISLTGFSLFEDDQAEDLIIYNIETAIILIMTIAGMYLSYKINSLGDNRDFVARYVVLGFPVLVRTTVFFIAIFFMVAISFEDRILDNQYVESTLIFLGEFLNIILLARAMRRASRVDLKS